MKRNLFNLKIKEIFLKIACCLTLTAFFSAHSFETRAVEITKLVKDNDAPPVSVAEVRYEKLMKIYLNQVKLAFSETDDARALAILRQFQADFNLKTEGVKQEFHGTLKQMSPQQKEKFYARLTQRSHIDELMALLFDERITSRMAANAEIKLVMDQLYVKSLEVPKTGREFIATGQ